MPRSTALVIGVSVVVLLSLSFLSWGALFGDAYRFFWSRAAFALPGFLLVLAFGHGLWQRYRTSDLKIKPNAALDSIPIRYYPWILLAYSIGSLMFCCYCIHYHQPDALCDVGDINEGVGQLIERELCSFPNCFHPEYSFSPPLPSHLHSEIISDRRTFLTLAPERPYQQIHRLTLRCFFPLYPFEIRLQGNMFRIHIEPEAKAHQYLKGEVEGPDSEQAVERRKRQLLENAETDLRIFFLLIFLAYLAGYLALFYQPKHD